MDPRVRRILAKETNRQSSTVELIASENFASQDVMKLCGSVFTNKYAEGYPGKRYYNGCEYMDEIEELAIDLLCGLYGSEFANVQPHSGANANTAVFQALLNPGDTILGMDLASGGHLSHGASVNISGKVYDAHSYGVNADGWLDYAEVYDQVQQLKPKLIIAGASAYPRQIEWKTFKQIANDCGAFLVADIAHYSGLIAGGQYESPVGIADVITSTTHKTLRGPRGGFILWNDDLYTKTINSAIFPGTQGGPLMNMIAAKAQAFSEALQPYFKTYAKKVISNAQAMAHEFKQHGVKMITDGTDSHIILIDLRDSKYSGRDAADILEEHGITVNKNGVPNDPRNFVETSGIRIGTAAETTRGWNEQMFADLAGKISGLLT